MSLFPETIARALAGGTVQCANLVLFDFASEPVRLWTGGFHLKTNDGAVWKNVGAFGSMSGIEQAVNGQAPQGTFTLSGVDTEVMRLTRDEFEDEVRGRTVSVQIQFFGANDEADPDNQRPLDLPYPVWSARCISPTFTLTPEGERSVAISTEGLFSLRSRPPYAMYTHSDQQERFAGDDGFEFVPTLPNKVLTWPDF